MRDKSLNSQEASGFLAWIACLRRVRTCKDFGVAGTQQLNSHPPVAVHPGVLGLSLDLFAQRLHIGSGPPLDPRQQRQREAFDAHVHIRAVPAANLFEFRILGPFVKRPFEDLVANVDESCALEVLDALCRAIERATDFVGCFQKGSLPAIYCGR